MITTNTIPFASAAMGYDREQVDRYFQKVAGEYSSLQRLYAELSAKHNTLVQQSSDNMEAISKAMVDAKIHAIKVVSEANAEASKIVNGAHDDLKMIQYERTRLTAEINDIVSRLKLLGYGKEPYSP